MAVLLRRLVSTNKRRYQQHGYDLDLSYITPRIIAMGFPCDGVSRLYRNPLDDVVRLLEERHAGHYRVYNLCVERGYDPGVFKGRVMRVPMYDGQAPPLQLMVEVCCDAAAWLAADSEHVVAVHCKAGKGRTGAVVCALLLSLDPELGPDSLSKALALWAERRTKDSKGLCIPSQRRFVSHFQQLLLAAGASCPAPAANGIDIGALHNGEQHGAPQASHPQIQTQQQQPAPQPANCGGLWSQPGIPPLLAAAAVPRRPVKLLRVRFQGLPPWLLRDCTASVWWRPVGHHEAYALCHVRTSTSGGCIGRLPEVHGPGGGAATVGSLSPHDPSGGSGGGSGGGATSAQDLCVDLRGLSPFQPPSPSPLYYYTPYIQSGDCSSDAAAPGTSLSARFPGLDPMNSPSGKPAQGVFAYESHDAAAGAKPGRPLVVSGDVKIQLFRGAIADPPHDVFNGSGTQFSAWVCTAYLDPRVGSLHLGRAELDKLSKRLRRWSSAVGIVLEYEALQR